MYRPILSVIGAAAAMVMLAGCYGVKKDSTFDGKLMGTPAVSRVSLVADLVVAETKVKGRAWGDYTNKAAVEKAALSNAFSQNPSGSTPDVLVAPNYYYEHDLASGVLAVTVVGYPAYYKNFRPDPKLERSAATVTEPTEDSAVEPAPDQQDYQAPAVSEQSEYETPAAPAQPLYQAPAAPAQPAYQAPAPPPQPVYQKPAPINILPRAPQPTTGQSPIITNTP